MDQIGKCVSKAQFSLFHFCTLLEGFLYTSQNKSKTLQFLWLQIKILRCASLGLIRSSVKWSCDFLGGINPPICYTQLNCCVGRVILCKMPYGRQMLWKMCFACIWSRSKLVNPAITTLQSLHCVHYDVPSPITQTLNWTGCNWSGTYILGLFFCEEVMLCLLSCVNLFLLWIWTDMLWPCMATYFWFPYQCYLRQTQSCFSRRPSYLREKFKNIPFSWVHPVWGTVEEVHGVKFQLDLVLVLVLSSSIIGC